MSGQIPPAAKPSISDSLAGAAGMVQDLQGRAAQIERIAAAVIEVLRGGGKVLTCGNGGSAAEAMHFTEELVGRFHARRQALGAICLNSDPTTLTCIANDWEYAEVFARQVEALGRPGDLLVALSTSGRSPSVVRGLERARQLGLRTLGLLGPPGSAAESHCDVALTFVGHAGARIQEAHLLVIHLCLEQVDGAFAKSAN